MFSVQLPHTSNLPKECNLHVADACKLSDWLAVSLLCPDTIFDFIYFCCQQVTDCLLLGQQAPHRAHPAAAPISPKPAYERPASPSAYSQAAAHPAARPDPYAQAAYYQHMKHAAAAKEGAGQPPAAYPGYPPYPGMPAASGYMRPPSHADPEAFKFQAGMPVPPGPQSDVSKDSDEMTATQMRPQSAHSAHRGPDNGPQRRMALPGRAPAVALTGRPGTAAAAGGGQIIRRKGGPMRGTHPAEINKQITTAKDVWTITEIVLAHGAEFDAVNVATALHRMAKACPEDPTELLRSNGFEQLLMMVEAQV